jgi:hypothetical protein
LLFFTPHEAIFPISSLFLYVSVCVFFFTHSHTYAQVRNRHLLIQQSGHTAAPFRVVFVSPPTLPAGTLDTFHWLSKTISFGERERDYFWWRDTGAAVPSVESNQIASALPKRSFSRDQRPKNNKI